jgi:hypothetical protein
MNDAVTAIALADRLGDGKRPDLAPAVGALARQLSRQREGALDELAKRWKAFRIQRRCWSQAGLFPLFTNNDRKA